MTKSITQQLNTQTPLLRQRAIYDLVHASTHLYTSELLQGGHFEEQNQRTISFLKTEI